MDPGVRVDPLDHGDHTLQLDRLLRVELRGKGVMGRHRTDGTHEDHSGKHRANFGLSLVVAWAEDRPWNQRVNSFRRV